MTHHPHPEDVALGRLARDVAEVASATRNPSLAIALIIVEAQRHVASITADAKTQVDHLTQRPPTMTA